MNKKRKAFGEIPQEASQNLQAPELAPSDKRITGRTKQLNFKVREDFYWQLKNRAVEEKCMLVEVLEKALECYEKHQKKQPQPQPSKPKPLNRFIKVDFNCDKCHQRFEKDTVYSPAPNLDQIKDYPTYCVDCGENKPEFCSFRTKAN